jgi:hypothetical protein
MANTSELVVAGWNAANSFDPNRGLQHIETAFQTVDSFGDDVNVLCISELAGRYSSDLLMNDEHLDMIQTGMANLGYFNSIITGGVRPDLVLSLWSRLEGDMDSVQLGNGLTLPRLRVDDFGDVIGIHNRSDSEPERVSVSRALINLASGGNGIATKSLLVGDFNSSYADDKDIRIRQLTDNVLRWLPRFNYYQGSKLKRLAGTVIRACEMTRGEAMGILLEAGFYDADPGFEPTVFYESQLLGGLLSQRVDHILATSDLVLDRFTLLPRGLGGQDPISDHVGVKARAKKRLETEH